MEIDRKQITPRQRDVQRPSIAFRAVDIRILILRAFVSGRTALARRRDEPERSSIIIFFSHSASLFIYPRRCLSKAATNMVYGAPRSRSPPEGREQGRISTGPSPVEHNAPIIFSPFVYPACVHCLYNVPGVGVISRLLHLLDLSFSFLFAVANGHDTIVKPKEALDDARTSRRIQRGRKGWLVAGVEKDRIRQARRPGTITVISHGRRK